MTITKSRTQSADFFENKHGSKKPNKEKMGFYTTKDTAILKSKGQRKQDRMKEGCQSH